MKASQIKLFKHQPELTEKHIENLTKRGLLVPEKSPRKRPNCKDEITNPTAGEVVGYFNLNKVLKAGKVSQDDARRLLAIETVRTNGRPRQSHINRLIIVAFSKDKSVVLDKIEKYRQQAWAKKAQ